MVRRRKEIGGLRREMMTKFEAVDSRFNGVDARSRFEAVDSMFDTLETRLQTMEKMVEFAQYARCRMQD